MASLYPFPPQNDKGQGLCLDEKVSEPNVPEWLQQPHRVQEWHQHEEFILHNQGQRAQKSMHSSPIAKGEEILATAPVGSRSWHHPLGTGFRDIQNAGIVELRRFTPRFQKAWLVRKYVKG